MILKYIHTGVLIAASNFPSWTNVQFSKLVSECMDNIPVTLLNDADAAIAAEIWGTDGLVTHAGVQHAVILS